jgi:hypothetical protein
MSTNKFAFDYQRTIIVLANRRDGKWWRLKASSIDGQRSRGTTLRRRILHFGFGPVDGLAGGDFGGPCRVLSGWIDVVDFAMRDSYFPGFGGGGGGDFFGGP